MSRRGIPIIYYILTGLVSLAVTICVIGWFRQYSLLFGSYTVSTVTLIVSGFLSLSLGCYVSGKLVNRTSHPLFFFIGIAVLTGLFVLLQPIFFDRITELFLRINGIQNPGPLRVEMLRFLLSFAILVIPACLFACSFLMLIKHFIKHISYSGRYMSAAVFAGSVGTITGQLISTLVLVPQFGIRTSLVLGAMVNLLTAVLAFSYLYISRLMVSKDPRHAQSERANKTSLRFKKKKIVLETGVKLTRAMLRVYAFQGFTLVSMLLLCNRMLENYNLLKPVYYYSLLLTIVLVGLALGSALYKRISEKPVNKYMTLATLQIIAGFGAVLSLVILNITGDKLYDLSLAARTFTGLQFKQGLLFASLLLIPAVITGLSLPLAGNIYPKRIQKVGSYLGHLGSILFLSSMAGVMIVLFVLIPFAGLNYAYFLLVLMIIFSGIYLIFRDSRLIRVFRLSYAVTVVILFIIIMGFFRSLNKMQRSPIKMKIEGSASTVSTVENPDSTLSVFINGEYYFGSDPGSLKAQQLPAYLPVLINPTIQSALVIGFGTGITACRLEECGIQSIHITDVFPEIIKLSSDVFADENNDIMTNSHVDITIEGARSYLFRSADKIDLITSGIIQFYQMPDIHTTEFYQICYNKLSEQGMLCQVLPANNITAIEFRALLKSCAIVFPNISLWYISPENILLLASKRQNKLELCHLSASFSAMNTNHSLSGIGIPGIESLLAHIIMDNDQIRNLVGKEPENSDNHPFVAYFHEPATHKNNNVLPLFFKTTVNYSRFLELGENCQPDTTEMFRQVRRLNRSLLQQADLSYGLQKWNVIDFFEWTGLPFRQYL
jgi:predicted membrane-bound spermidine synthase